MFSKTLKLEKMAYKKVVEMLGDNLASFLELAKKLIVDWKIPVNNLLHTLHNQSKDDVFGLIEGTHKIVSISLSGKTIRSVIEKFVVEAKKQDIPLYYTNEYGVDADIFNWLPGAVVVEGDAPIGIITILRQNTTEGEMVKTALKLPLSQAIERMTQAVAEGFFSKNLKWLVIYLTDTKNGVPLELVCCRGDGQLNLHVSEVASVDVWLVDGDREVGFLSNES